MYLASHRQMKKKSARRSLYRRQVRLEQITENLIQRLEYQAKIQGLLHIPRKMELRDKEPSNFFNIMADSAGLSATNPGTV
jgi:hypothetical protein